MNAALFSGLLAGFGIAVPVGAVGAYLVTLAARTPLRTGAAAALGVATADGLYALIAVVGGSSLGQVIEPVATPLRWISALVLVVLATRSAALAVSGYRERNATGRSDGAPPGPTRAYLTLLGMTMLNPTTVIYFAAVVLGDRTAAGVPTPWEQSMFVLAAFAASAGWQMMLAGGGALLGSSLTSRRGRLVTHLAASTLISALAVQLLVQRS